MNLFILDEDPELSAQYACDKHVVKMPLETCQMLCAAHHVLNPNSPYLPLLYKLTHRNHPCSKWVRFNVANYMWTYMFWHYQCEEYTYRYGKTHLSWSKYSILLGSPPPLISAGQRTAFALAMPEQYMSPEPVDAYRAYYKAEKAHILQYTNRDMPEWLHATNV